MKTDFLLALKEVDNFTFTENGAIALKSTGNAVLDAFGSLGAMKDSSIEDILNIFYKAFYENKELALRLLFYIRDIRGGQGMRRVFRIIVRSLANNHPEYIIANLDNFLFFGRGDDVLCLLDTPVEDEVYKWVTKVLIEDMNAVMAGNYPSMLAKWLPSENTSSKETKYLAKKMIAGLKVTPKNYRKTLTKLRKKIGIVEQLMSANEWDKINFEKLPAKASIIYSDAFGKHIEEKYINYIKGLADGTTKANSASLFPVDIVHKVYNRNPKTKFDVLRDTYLYEAMWKALPNYFENRIDTGLCVVDTSGSMDGTPLEVAISLGMYCADKCKGPFKNHFITFSRHPKLQEIKGNNIIEKINNISEADWGMNTNLEAVFDLILKTAISHKLAQEDLPNKLYIISDMQFDEARDAYDKNYTPFMQTMKEKFIEAGYTMPAIIYWNVRASECGMFQQKFEDEDCCMVSGYSASLFKSIIEGTEYIEDTVVDEKGNKVKITKQKLEPIKVMTTTLMNERYDRVVVDAELYL